MMFLMMTLTSVTHAEWPSYWKGDKKFPLIFGFRMNSFYLDRTSMVVKENNPPYYVIAANVFSVENNTDYSYQSNAIKHTWTFEIRYDDNETSMYLKTDDGWTYLSPLATGSTREQEMAMNAGEAMWYVFKGSKFYGAYTWTDSKHSKAESPTFTNGLYDRL